jgi:hypothetical protein
MQRRWNEQLLAYESPVIDAEPASVMTGIARLLSISHGVTW